MSDKTIYTNKAMEKSASWANLAQHVIEAFSLGAAAHVAQNQIAKVALTSKHLSPIYKQHFLSGVSKKLPSIGVQIKKGLSSPITPETGIISDELVHLGSHFEQYLNKVGKSYKYLTHKEHELLSKTMAGDFTHLKDNAQAHPHLVAALGSTLRSQGQSAIADMLKRALHPETGPKALRKLSYDYKQSYVGDILGKVFHNPSIRDMRGMKTPTKFRTAVNTAASVIPEIAVNGAIGYVEPIAPLLNVGKRLVNSKTLGSKFKPLDRLQKWVGNKMLVSPIKTNVAAGNLGEFKPANKMETFIKRDLLNPVIFDTQQTAGKLAQDLDKYR